MLPSTAYTADLEPRAASPWDSLLHSSPLSARDTPAASGTLLAVKSLQDEVDPSRIPKLVPEMEEGNVEYKLKLRKSLQWRCVHETLTRRHSRSFTRSLCKTGYATEMEAS
jgi:hypothetical protein